MGPELKYRGRVLALQEANPALLPDTLYNAPSTARSDPRVLLGVCGGKMKGTSPCPRASSWPLQQEVATSQSLDPSCTLPSTPPHN